MPHEHTSSTNETLSRAAANNNSATGLSRSAVVPLQKMPEGKEGEDSSFEERERMHATTFKPFTESSVNRNAGKALSDVRPFQLKTSKVLQMMQGNNTGFRSGDLVQGNGSGIIQAKINDPLVQARIRSRFTGPLPISQSILNILLQDAFDNTNSYEEAVMRIQRGLQHEMSIYGPPSQYGMDMEDDSFEEEIPQSGIKTDQDEEVGKKEKEVPKVVIDMFDNDDVVEKEKEEPKISNNISGGRAPIDISKDRVKPEFVSSVPESEVEESDVTDEWSGLNTKKFYAKVRELLKVARDEDDIGQSDAQDKLDKLIQGYKQHDTVKKMIDGFVRVKAVKAKGASSGTGLDELFKTSETMKYLELSYRPPEGVMSVAKFDGEEFDWMDAQEQIRLSTELIVWAGDLVEEISGHTGTFQKQYKGKWMVAKQALMHEVRDESISKRSNPATAIIEAIGTHLRVTENVEGFAKELYKTDVAKITLTTNGVSLDERYSDIAEQLEQHRDMLKTFFYYVSAKLETIGPSSPLRPRHNSSKYYDLSPKRNNDFEIDEKKGKVDGNPLPNLSTQWRMTHGDGKKTIPAKPIHPAIVEARKTVKDVLDKKTSDSIHASAKRQAKKLDEDAEPNEEDKVMLRIYIERLEGKEEKEIVELVKKLQTALDEL